MTEPHNQSAEYCTVCGEPATTAWHGVGVIATCEKCAIEVLPAMIANAITLAPGGTGPKRFDQCKRVVERVAACFWRAMTCRLLRGRD